MGGGGRRKALTETQKTGTYSLTSSLPQQISHESGFLIFLARGTCSDEGKISKGASADLPLMYAMPLSSVVGVILTAAPLGPFSSLIFPMYAWASLGSRKKKPLDLPSCISQRQERRQTSPNGLIEIETVMLLLLLPMQMQMHMLISRGFRVYLHVGDVWGALAVRDGKDGYAPEPAVGQSCLSAEGRG